MVVWSGADSGFDPRLKLNGVRSLSSRCAPSVLDELNDVKQLTGIPQLLTWVKLISRNHDFVDGKREDSIYSCPKKSQFKSTQQ